VNAGDRVGNSDENDRRQQEQRPWLICNVLELFLLRRPFAGSVDLDERLNR
jgi:hypothetical protein